jgi:SAM-dependent methyltransferase
MRIAARKPSLRDAEAGCREPFIDADLYDYEYRQRRADINFYRALARNRTEFSSGTILDLACGTGRVLAPLARDGHQVIGVDRSEAMLAAAARRVARLSARRRAQCLLVRADIRDFALCHKASLAIAAFHSVQHLLSDADLEVFLRQTRANLHKGGWLAFDVLPPDPAWLGRDPDRRWGRTLFRHPKSGQQFVYTTNHYFDSRRRLLHMRLYYQPIDRQGRAGGPEHVIRLCHRQYWPEDVQHMLRLAGFRPTELFAGFDGRPLPSRCGAEKADEHVYLAVAE